MNPPKVEIINPTIYRLIKWMDYLLIIILLFASLHILFFYIKTFFYNTNETIAVKYAIYIAIGSFFYLFVYNKEIQGKLGYEQYEEEKIVKSLKKK